MKQKAHSHHWNDEDGNPAGGVYVTTGLTASFQNGPLGRGVDKKQPNGCWVEDLIAAGIDRLEMYERSKFACQSNRDAIHHLQNALEALESRTRDREKRGVEGEHKA